MTADWDNASAEMKRVESDMATSRGMYPGRATLTPRDGRAATTVLMRFADPRTGHDFEQQDFRITGDMQVTLYGIFPVGVVPRLGDDVLILEPADMAGQQYQVVVPMDPGEFGYRVGLAFVGGSPR